MTVVTIALFGYMKFAWFLPTQIWSVFYVLCLIEGMMSWYRTSYYITGKEMIVRIGKKNFCMPREAILPEECKEITTLTERVCRCKTIQYGVYYGFHSSRGPNANLWRDTARFWCIRDYGQVQRFLRKE